MPYKSAYNAVDLELLTFENMDCRFFLLKKKGKFILVCLVCFGLYIDVLSAFMRFSVIFCIYEHILNDTLGFVGTNRTNRKELVSENMFFVIFNSN